MLVIKNPTFRKILKIVVPFVLIPLVIIISAVIFKEKRYAFISVAVALCSVLLFMAGFEKKKTGTRRLIIVAVMVVLSVVGRFIPFFKPITALTVITAIYLGGEAGFLVGSMSAVVSNFYFGQGPWTPFQMFAWGMIGLFAGYLALPLKKNRVALVIYGVMSGIAYSAIMDVWSVLWYNGSVTPELFLAAAVTAIPHTLLYAVSNMIFLWCFAKPFGDKLERVKIKYGV